MLFAYFASIFSYIRNGTKSVITYIAYCNVYLLYIIYTIVSYYRKKQKQCVYILVISNKILNRIYNNKIYLLFHNCRSAIDIFNSKSLSKNQMVSFVQNFCKYDFQKLLKENKKPFEHKILYAQIKHQSQQLYKFLNKAQKAWVLLAITYCYLINFQHSIHI